MLLDMQRARRCGAKTRKGSSCQAPAMPNGRCRMHGESRRVRLKGTGMPGGMNTIQPMAWRCEGQFERY
jgi:hypothetical protein